MIFFLQFLFDYFLYYALMIKLTHSNLYHLFLFITLCNILSYQLLSSSKANQKWLLCQKKLFPISILNATHSFLVAISVLECNKNVVKKRIKARAIQFCDLTARQSPNEWTESVENVFSWNSGYVYTMYTTVRGCSFSERGKKCFLLKVWWVPFLSVVWLWFK